MVKLDRFVIEARRTTWAQDGGGQFAASLLLNTWDSGAFSNISESRRRLRLPHQQLHLWLKVSHGDDGTKVRPLQQVLQVGGGIPTPREHRSQLQDQPLLPLHVWHH